MFILLVEVLTGTTFQKINFIVGTPNLENLNSVWFRNSCIKSPKVLKHQCIFKISYKNVHWNAVFHGKNMEITQYPYNKEWLK